MKTKMFLFTTFLFYLSLLQSQNTFTLHVEYGYNQDVNQFVYGNHFSRLFDRCRCYDPWDPESAVDSIDQCMEYVASIKSKVIRVPSGGDNKWMHFNTDSVGYGFLASDVDTLLALGLIDTGTAEKQYSEVAEQYALNIDGARYIDRLIDLVQYCDSVNDFEPGIIFVANVTMSKWLPGMYNVYEENLSAIRYMIDNGINIVGIEMGNEHYDDDAIFPTFTSYWNHIRPLLDSLQADDELNSIPVSLTAAPEPDFAELFNWPASRVTRFKSWNTGLVAKAATSSKFDAYTVHIYQTARMMTPCYDIYSDSLAGYYGVAGVAPYEINFDAGAIDTLLQPAWQCAMDSFDRFVNYWMPWIFDRYDDSDSSYCLRTYKKYWLTEWGVKPPKEDRQPGEDELDTLVGNFNNTFAEAVLSNEYLLNLLDIDGTDGGAVAADLQFATKHNTLSGFTYGLTSYRGARDPIDDWYYKRASYYAFLVNENIFDNSFERVTGEAVPLDTSTYTPYVKTFLDEQTELFYMCFANTIADTVVFKIHEITGDLSPLGYGSLTPMSSYGSYMNNVRTTQLFSHGGDNQYIRDNAFYDTLTVNSMIDSIYYDYHSTGFPDSIVRLPPYSFGWLKWQLSPIPDRVGIKDNISLTAYPNPSNGFINFEINSDSDNFENYTMNFYTIYGAKVDEISINQASFTWNGENIPKGIYFYELEDASQKLGNGKIILQ